MVYAFYQVTETLGEHPADERHESLKNPKAKAMTSIGLHWVRFKIIPLAIETAKQSIAKPIASSQISSPVIIF